MLSHLSILLSCFQVRTLKQKINTLEEELATCRSNSFHPQQQPGNQSQSSGASETSLWQDK